MERLRTSGIVGIQAALIAAVPLLQRLSFVDGSPPYATTVVVLIAELNKLLVSLAVVAWTSQKRRLNYWQFVILSYITPAEYTLVWNSKIIVTTLLLRFVLGRKFRHGQWAAIVLLLAGLLVAETARDGQSLALDEKSLFGIQIELLAACLASVSNVFTERLYKVSDPDQFWLKNVRLYTFGIVFNSAGVVLDLLSDEDSPGKHADGIFGGFNFLVVVIVLLTSFSGMIVGVLMQNVDNMAVIHADAVGTVANIVLSTWFFGLAPHPSFALGAGMVLAAVYWYHVPCDALLFRNRMSQPIEGSSGADHSLDCGTQGYAVVASEVVGKSGGADSFL
eukprot:TRINITY_DN72275_c0_g1_i1.p1 TRINITY_DN72275_c0_g1~~TRINITY_DN72275_c0_g1_i1.p1  ORF type:complete len:335 (+),score=47.13 TRINITY_DN72275_c0_g1_i1:128-1132(+)